jgi:hypothetical protein
MLEIIPNYSPTDNDIRKMIVLVYPTKAIDEYTVKPKVKG